MSFRIYRALTANPVNYLIISFSKVLIANHTIKYVTIYMSLVLTELLTK